MLNNKTIIKIAVVIITAVLLYIMGSQLNKAYNTIDKLRSDRISLIKDTEVLKTDKGNLLNIVHGLNVDKKELKQLNDSILNQLKDYKVKLKDVSEIVTIQQTTIIKLNQKLKDSTIVKIEKDTMYLDTIKCFDYKDDYNTLIGCIEDDTINATFSSSVPLNIVMENIYKHKFLWFRWGVINKKLIVTTPNKAVTFPDIKLYIPN